MNPTITSPQNEKIKATARLHQKKARDEEGLILIEGQHPIEEAINTGIKFMSLFVLENDNTSLSQNIDCEVYPVTDAVMKKLSTTKTPAPILGVAMKPKSTDNNLFSNDTTLTLALINIQDPGNLGTIIRSACAFGVSSIILVGDNVDAYNPKVIRASAGLIFRKPLTQLNSVEQLIKLTQPHPELSILGADAHKGEPYHQLKPSEKTLLLLGGEAHGLPEETWQIAKPIHIPMVKEAESLNVSAAGAILLSELYRNKKP